MERVVPNETGSLVALVGRNGCAVVRTTQRDRATHTMRVAHVGRVFYAARPGLRIVHACWHPASLSHLALLCSDGCVRLYAMGTGDVEDPEQVLRPTVEGELVACAFGASGDWEPLTLYVATADRRVYVQCPVVPRNLSLPEALTQRLLHRQLHEVTRLEAETHTAHHAVGDSRKMVRHSTRLWKNARRVLRWLEAGMPPSEHEAATQGPLSAAEEEGAAALQGTRCCAFAVLPTALPVLVSLFENGVLEAHLQLQCAGPLWVGGDADVDVSHCAMILDRVDLGPSLAKGSSSFGGALRSGPVPRLFADPLQCTVWYVAHAGGIDCVAFPRLGTCALAPSRPRH